MADRSTKVVYAALAGNVLVALSKFVAAALSGSSAMLTEGIHSSADTLNQVLLLIGTRRSHARPDASHAFGYGMEVYFWAFVVAVMVLFVGAAASFYEGVAELRNVRPISAPGVSLAVLALSMLFEGASFSVGYREYKRIVRGRKVDGQHVGLWRFIAISKDPNLYESLLEDMTALIGIAIAATGVVASAYFGVLWADGAASVAIGVLLMADAAVIAAATRSLIAGEAAAPPILAQIEALRTEGTSLHIPEVRTLQLGPRTILVAVTISVTPGQSVPTVGREMDEFSERIKALDRRISDVLFRFA
jgi:cation diffusion facilitator family transporter